MQAATPLKIRRAQSDDAPVISQLLHESFVEFKALYTDGGFAATAPGADQILIRLQEGPVWLALSENAVLGTVAAVIKDASVYIRGMAVVPWARGMGVGVALLQRAEDWAAVQSYQRLFLSTTPFLSSAIRLYERSGFRRSNKDPHELFGTPLLVMEKTLPRRPTR